MAVGPLEIGKLSQPHNDTVSPGAVPSKQAQMSTMQRNQGCKNNGDGNA